MSPAARSLHKAILRNFATTGVAPEIATLDAHVDGRDGLDVLLAELHEHDVIRLDEPGAVRAAYPFSGIPTAHLVVIGGGPTVHAMCAIDALGMADMLGRDVTITSADPTSGEEIDVEIRGGFLDAGHGGRLRRHLLPDRRWLLPPDSTADRCCAVMNFFANPDGAKRWLTRHPQVSGVILTQGQALCLGVDIFGRLLDDQP